jgi:hypothetical protein
MHEAALIHALDNIPRLKSSNELITRDNSASLREESLHLDNSNSIGFNAFHSDEP